jgi:alpha-L-rhamnosidase
MGDAQFASQGMMYTFDAVRFYESFLRSIRDEQVKGCSSSPALPQKRPCIASQLLNGSVPDATPFSNQAGPNFPGSVVWMSAYVTIARNLWRHYGEAASPVLREHYTGLQEFMRFLRTCVDYRTGLVLTAGMGEWAPPQSQSVNKNRTTPAAAASAFYGLLDLKHMAEIAQALGQTADAAAYHAEFMRGRTAYHAEFAIKKDTGAPAWCFYTGCTQTAHLMPLAIDAVPAKIRPAVERGLITLIKDGDSSYRGVPNVSGPIPPMHLAVGTIGSVLILDTLTAMGADDIALSLLLTDTFPSYGLMVASDIDAPPESGRAFPQRGSSSLWETWEGQSSRNHIMSGGQLQSYFYSSIAGLDTESTGSSSGWQKVLFQPTHAAVRRLGHAAAEIKTPLGTASVAWTLVSKTLAINATVPGGATGELSFPLLGLNSDSVSISETGVLVWSAGKFIAGGRRGVSAGYVTRRGANEAVTFTVASGMRYSFVADVVW